jgi:hypothetical protein
MLLYLYRTRETREGWPLLTVETEANGTQRVQMKEAFPWLVRWALRTATREFFYPALAALVSPVQNSFSSPCTLLQFYVSLSI